MKNIAVFISGRGSNSDRLLEAGKKGKIKGGRITLVFSNNKNALGLRTGRAAGLDVLSIESGDYSSRTKYFEKVVAELDKREIDFICLAGFTMILPYSFVKKYDKRIINIHPGPLPRFGGVGMFGINVHRKVLESNLKNTEVTVHYVDRGVDTGKIIMVKTVRINKTDTSESLAVRALRVEHQIYWRALNKALYMSENTTRRLEEGK